MPEDSRYKFETFTCSKCDFVCYTLNELQEHNLDKHSFNLSGRYLPDLKYCSSNGFSYKEVKDDIT